MLSFTAEVFFSLLGQYNRAIWPVQIFAGLLGLGAVLLASRPAVGSDRVVAAILAVAWLWVAIAFHWAYFGTISFVAPVAAACFAVQAAFLVWRGVFRGDLAFRLRASLAGWSGLGLMLFALAIYPLLGGFAGRPWSSVAWFGVAPCPTVIGTIGLLLLIDGPPPLGLMAVPLLWALTAGAAAWFLAMPEVLMLPAIAVAGLILMLRENRRRARHQSEATISR
jgi:hypothetical protein